jgi:predicted unusual protein kinase regulating ubiquinone biosynthesis (AarF/ABC1/UbiB family)
LQYARAQSIFDEAATKLQAIAQDQAQYKQLVVGLLQQGFLALLEPTFDFAPIIKEINVEHKKELDFGQERANLVDVRRNFGKGGRVPVTVPELVEELTN